MKLELLLFAVISICLGQEDNAFSFQISGKLLQNSQEIDYDEGEIHSIQHDLQYSSIIDIYDVLPSSGSNQLIETSSPQNINVFQNQMDSENELNNEFGSQNMEDPIENTQIQTETQVQINFTNDQVNNNGEQALSLTTNTNSQKNVAISDQYNEDDYNWDADNEDTTNNINLDMENEDLEVIQPNNELSNCIVLYSQCNYQGESIKACESLEKLKDFQYPIMSIYIPEGQQITIFSKSEFQGQSQTFDANQECLETPVFTQIGNNLAHQNLRRVD